MRRPRTTWRLPLALLVVLASGCAPTVTVSLPDGSGRPDPAVEARFLAASGRCADIRTFSAELSIAGRVRGQTVRGRVLAGSTRAGDARLEGVSPFGAPVFVLAVTEERASLLLPREGRVLRGAPAEQVLDALVGLKLSAADLHALLIGCVAANPQPANGRAYDRGWMSVDLGGDRTAFLQDGPGGPRVTGARVGALSVGYDAFEGGAPTEVRLASDGDDRSAVRLVLRLSQVEENVSLPPEAFVLETPADARPLSLDELRARGVSLAARPS
jgi:hypothetical protein